MWETSNAVALELALRLGVALRAVVLRGVDVTGEHVETRKQTTLHMANPAAQIAPSGGKVRMTCSTWEDARVLAPGEMLGLRREGTFWVVTRIEAKKA